MSDAREFELEIFRADTPASKGITAADIAHAATAYDPAKNPAPLVKGHPEHDKPAVGLITSVRAEGARLFAKVANVADDVLQGIRDKQWINRSAAFWHPDHPSNPTPGKYSIRHLGLLGASTPAIAGMEPMKFNADESVIEIPSAPFTADIVEFEPEPTPTRTIKEKPAVTDKPIAEQPEFLAEKKRADDAAAELEALRNTAKRDREAANVAFVSSLVEAGKLPPGHKADLILAFNALPADELTFKAEDGTDRKESPVAYFRRLFDSAKPQVIFEAITPKKTTTQADPKSRTSIEAAAREYMEANKGTTFAAAMEHVATELGL